MQDQCVHGGALVDHVPDPKLEKMKGIACEEFQLLNLGNDRERLAHQAMPRHSGLVSLPEGRVHGGSLLAMLASSPGLGSLSGGQAEGGNSERGMPYKLVHNWI